jgi:uncharacterized coiled-coil DUF342 family protein
MSDKTVEEIMGLAITFASARYYSVGAQENEPRERLREAITALAAERDQAVENFHSMTTATREFQADFNRIVGEYRTIKQDCDALKARVEELEKAS